MDREKTDSITHLVKIVAKEVFEEEMRRYPFFGTQTRSLMERVEHLETLLKKDAEPALTNENTVTYASAVNAGRPWGHFEEGFLKQALMKTFEVLAERHGRTPGAIKERLRLLVKESKI